MINFHRDGPVMYRKNAQQSSMLMLTVGVFLQQVAVEMSEAGELESNLGQLPGHHPLIKDGMSDDGQSHQEHVELHLSSLCNIPPVVLH